MYCCKEYYKAMEHAYLAMITVYGECLPIHCKGGLCKFPP